MIFLLIAGICFAAAGFLVNGTMGAVIGALIFLGICVGFWLAVIALVEIIPSMFKGN